MKRIFLLLIVLFITCGLFAQSEAELSGIKLFLDPQTLANVNKGLPDNLQRRLLIKITQLINQTGIAEAGYSNFLVVPRFDILSVTEDDAGMGKIYMAECELSLSVERRAYSQLGAGTFASFSKKLIGSSMNKDEAVSNAISSIKSTDEKLVAFLQQSKVQIIAYFKTHCDEVIAEAKHASDLNDYAKSISLYFSVPSGAPCYKKATEASQQVYSKYVSDKCNRQLLNLKAYVARAQNTDSFSTSFYNGALRIIDELDPASGDCYAEAERLIEKIEKRFDEKQKQEWELKKKAAADGTEIQKSMYKAMSRISTTYQPAASPTVIIAK